MKHILSLFLVLCMLLSLASGMAMAAPAEEPASPRVLTDEDYVLTDLVWDEIRALEATLEAEDATRAQRIDAVAKLIQNSANYVEGSLERNPDNMTWDTDEGIACMYTYDKEEPCDDREGIPGEILPENLENYSFTSYAKKGSPRGIDVYVLGPWYAYDSSFNNSYGVGYYREFADKLAQATGGTSTVYRNKDVTIDVIADCIEKGAIVMIDSHGTYSYRSGRYRNYLRLSTGTGLTDADYSDGNAYYDSGYSHGPAWMVTGTVISNHMEKDAPNSFVWLGICSGMRYESMHKPLLERGVEACMGYSRTISFEWDRYWLSAFTAALAEGKDVAAAATAMKNKYGKWDRNTESSYNTLQKALNNEKAFPIFVSDKDTYPASNTQAEYPSAVQIIQSVYSNWRLFCEHNNGSTFVPGVAATCTTAGNKEHYACNICKTAFSDAAMTNIINASGITIPALGHTTTSGICGRCGYVSGITMLHFWAGSNEAKTNWTFEGASGTSGVDTSNGGVLYSTSNGTDHYFHHPSGATAVGHTVKSGDIIEVRYRTVNVPSAQLNTTGTFELWYTTPSTDSSLANGTVLKASVKRLENTWQTAQFTPTTGHSISRLLFDVVEENKGYSGTKVEIDYVYIGPASNKPSVQASNSMLFHFDNKFTDELRYASSVYGDRNYDIGFWTGNSSRIGTISYGGSAVSFPYVDGTTSAYIQTTEGNKNLSSLPLSYKPAANDMVQIRLKLENLRPVDGETPSVKLYYIKNNSTSGVANGDYTELQKLNTSHFSGEEFVITASLNSNFTAASVINALRITFDNMTNVSGKTGKVTVDYIAIGQLSSLPVPSVPCTVTFKDEAGNVVDTQTTVVGGSVTYGGAPLTKAYDTANHYTFNGWKNENGAVADLSKISGDCVFYASFKAEAHGFKEEVIAQPGCTATGLNRYTCTTCGYSYDSDPIPATGHKLVTDAGYAATCTTPGMTDGSHCSVCNVVVVAQTVIPAKGHTEVVVPGYAPGCLSSGMTDGITCSVCNTVLQAQQPIARLGHEYTYTDNGDGTHSGVCIRCEKAQNNKPHTFQDGVCTDCGNGGNTAPEVDASIVLRHTLNLASDISINYAVEAALLSQYDSYYLTCNIPVYEGNTYVGTNSVQIQPELNGYFYYFTLEGLTAVNINDTIEATLTMQKGAQKYESNVDVYSVATYAYSQLEKPTNTEALKTLCAELLRYGAKAQLYKNYRTDALADTALTDAQAALLSDMEAVTFANNNLDLNDLASPAIAWVGKALDLNSKVTLKYIFNATGYTGNVSELTLRIRYVDVSGKVATHTVKGAEVYNPTQNWYNFDVDTLLAAELRSVVSAAIYNGDTQISSTLVYSADTYANGKTGTLLTLCKALFAYSDSAKAYFAG